MADGKEEVREVLRAVAESKLSVNDAELQLYGTQLQPPKVVEKVIERDTSGNGCAY